MTPMPRRFSYEGEGTESAVLDLPESIYLARVKALQCDVQPRHPLRGVTGGAKVPAVHIRRKSIPALSHNIAVHHEHAVDLPWNELTQPVFDTCAMA